MREALRLAARGGESAVKTFLIKYRDIDGTEQVLQVRGVSEFDAVRQLRAASTFGICIGEKPSFMARVKTALKNIFSREGSINHFP